VSSFIYTVEEIGQGIRDNLTKVVTDPLTHLVGGLFLAARALWLVPLFLLSRVVARPLMIVRYPSTSLIVWPARVLVLAGRSVWMTTSLPYGYLLRVKDAVTPRTRLGGSISLTPLVAQPFSKARYPFIFVLRLAGILASVVRSLWMVTSLPYGYLIRAKDAVTPQRSLGISISPTHLVEGPLSVGRYPLNFVVRTVGVLASVVSSIWMVTSLPYGYLVRLKDAVTPKRSLGVPISPTLLVTRPVSVGRYPFIFVLRLAGALASAGRTVWMTTSLPYGYLLKLVSQVRRHRNLEEAIPPANPIEALIPLTSPVEQPGSTTPQPGVRRFGLAGRSLFKVIAAPVAYPAKGLIWADRTVRLGASVVLTRISVRSLLTIRYLFLGLLTPFISLAKGLILVGRVVGSAAIIPPVLLAFYAWLWLTTPIVSMAQSIRSAVSKVFLLMAFPMVLLGVWLAMAAEPLRLRPILAVVSLPGRLAFRGGYPDSFSGVLRRRAS